MQTNGKMEEKTIFIQIEEVDSAAPIRNMEITFPSANQSQCDIQQVKKVICEEKPAMASLFSRAKIVFQKMGKKFKDRWFDLEESEELDDMGEYRCLISRNKESGKLLFLDTCNPVTFINSPIIA